jgi:oxalate decarboxylase/phosphoglucose isomerase-like protein (cupin superfamily)
MDEVLTQELRRLAQVAASRKPPVDPDPFECVRVARAPGVQMYANKNERLGIEFAVERVNFPGVQTMDPRIVRIPPGRNNERHKHAHESLFVILEGRGEVLIGDKRVPVQRGDVAFVPRWLYHQTINTGDSELVVLAVTDFGFASAVLGDYDQHHRLRGSGVEAVQQEKESRS